MKEHLYEEAKEYAHLKIHEWDEENVVPEQATKQPPLPDNGYITLTKGFLAFEPYPGHLRMHIVRPDDTYLAVNICMREISLLIEYLSDAEADLKELHTWKSTQQATHDAYQRHHSRRANQIEKLMREYIESKLGEPQP